MSIPFKKVRSKLGLNDHLPDGRHRGYTVLAILKDRPRYIKWLMDNTTIRFHSSVEHEMWKYLLELPRRKRYNSAYHKDYHDEDFGDWYAEADFF